jgi:hypothetical protein
MGFQGESGRYAAEYRFCNTDFCIFLWNGHFFLGLGGFRGGVPYQRVRSRTSRIAPILKIVESKKQ